MPNKYAKYSKVEEKLQNKLFIDEAVLDYHDKGPLTTYDITKMFEDFIELSYSQDLTYLLIITGKGSNSPKGAVIRPLIKKLLEKNKMIKRFKTADVARGGEGAFEVTLIE